MPIVWTEHETLKLVTLYSEHECLRNPLHPNFKDKLSRYKAYKNIVDHMNICGLTVCDCIKRITYIKAQYCYELSKIGAAISCEKFYKPTASWFPIIHQLFFPFITQDCINDFWKISHDKKDVFNDYREETNKQLTRSTSMELDTPGRDCICPYANCHCDISYLTKSRAHAKKVTKTDVGSNSRRSINTEHAAQTDVSYFKIKGTSCQIHLEDDILTAEDSKGKKKSYEEFDMFGKNIACQLRNIDFEIAIKLEKRIQDLIAQERLDNMKANCSECYTSSNCSECKIIRKEMVCNCGLPVIMIKTDQCCEFDCKQTL
ncbi:uncharacterized protein LOC117604749 [Osmia lignaria lignaria]|uniref:uncharacterized protein LOC117604749 n=1 Tax=Osmia lignaria lignaria TaxID=1437193 RepID=UPI001478B9D8|nr:uncharacterized protein LOC117604749 [Osmia lignaria]